MNLQQRLFAQRAGLLNENTEINEIFNKKFPLKIINNSVNGSSGLTYRILVNDMVKQAITIDHNEVDDPTGTFVPTTKIKVDASKQWIDINFYRNTSIDSDDFNDAPPGNLQGKVYKVDIDTSEGSNYYENIAKLLGTKKQKTAMSFMILGSVRSAFAKFLKTHPKIVTLDFSDEPRAEKIFKKVFSRLKSKYKLSKVKIKKNTIFVLYQSKEDLENFVSAANAPRARWEPTPTFSSRIVDFITKIIG